MSLSSASTVAALGMPLSDPCSASAPATTPQLQNVDLTGSKSISLWFATDSPLWFPKQHWRTAAARQQDGCWSVRSPIWASLDATNVRFRSQFDALASSAFIFASTVKPFAGRDCIIAPERG
jgi:hypothetical protein